MHSHKYHRAVVLSLILLLGVVACRRAEDEPTIPTLTPPPLLSDTGKKTVPTIEMKVVQPGAGQKMSKRKKIISHKPDTIHSSVIVTDSGNATIDVPKSDSNAALSFYIRESFANSLRTPSLKMEKPYVHPDSQTWEEIAGIPQRQEKASVWIEALGILNGVAGVLLVIYYLFFAI